MDTPNDGRDVRHSAGGSAPEGQVPHWHAVYASCEALAPDDGAWDGVDDFVRALQVLARARLSERERIGAERRTAVAAARARLSGLAEAVRSAPGSEGVAAEVDRVLGGRVSYRKADELVSAASAMEASVAAVAGLRADLVRHAQAWASPDEMEAIVHELRARQGDQTAHTAALLALLRAAAVDAGHEDARYDDGTGEMPAAAAAPAEPEADRPEAAGAAVTRPLVAEAPAADEGAPAVAPEPEPAPRSAAEDATPEPEERAAGAAHWTPAAPGDRKIFESRADAEQLYSDPQTALLADGALSERARELANLWLASSQKRPALRDRLRRVFAKFLGADSPDQPGSKVIRVDAATLRGQLEAEGAEGASLDRLGSLEALSVTSAPTSEGLSAAAFAQNLFAIASSGGDPRTLHVFLAPHLPAACRDEAVRRLRAGGIPAAVVDDVDLCRVLGPGSEPPPPLSALAAVIFEQLDAAAGAS